MSDWTSGYVSDIGYTYGYYNELNPTRSTLAFLNAGYAPPSTGVHCELGYGQGLSVNVHAAASGETWFATDFNPSQAAFAQSLASASGSDAHLSDEDFVKFCSRSDLPDFDSIGLHGIWSWISDENRAIIVDFIRRKLKVGGALYIAYNTQPGWATFAPMRHLMTEHSSVMGSPGQGVVSRVNGALVFAQKLLDTNPIFAKANPNVVERLKKVAAQDRHYLAHEYFNKDWHPMHFSTMSNWLTPAKISFACSANYHDHISAVNLSADQQAMLNEIVDSTFKESVRDFMVNQQFRKDYWVKGPRKLSTTEQTELINRHKLVLVNARENISLKIPSSLGEASLSEAVYAPILDLMSDHKVRNVQEIISMIQDKSIGFAQVVQAAMVLIGSGQMSSVQSDAQIAKAKKTSSKLNKALMEKAHYSAEISFLASPVTGGGIVVDRFQQLFLQSIIQGKHQPEEWANDVWSVLFSQNQRLLKEGQTLNSSEENVHELKKMATDFANKRMPILKALEVF